MSNNRKSWKRGKIGLFFCQTQHVAEFDSEYRQSHREVLVIAVWNKFPNLVNCQIEPIVYVGAGHANSDN